MILKVKIFIILLKFEQSFLTLPKILSYLKNHAKNYNNSNQ